MLKQTELPFYARLAFVLISIGLLVLLVFYCNSIVIPMTLSLMFAILLQPWVHFMQTKLKFYHVIASFTAVFLAITLIIIILVLISWQVGDIAGEWDKIQENLKIIFHNIQQSLFEKFNLSLKQQEIYIQEITQNAFADKRAFMGDTLSSLSAVMLNLVLIPFYTFLFLLYRNLFLTFLSKLFREQHHKRLQDILYQIKFSVQGYLVGLIVEMLLVSVLTSVGFMIVGIRYAILLGVITGILNMVPYIGIMFAALLSVMATFTDTPELSAIVWVLVVNILVQLIDNNILVPLVVSSKVKINALFTILGIVIGGFLAGIAGMFLAIPVVAIMKVIFDRIPSLEPWGFLLGDDLPGTMNWKKEKILESNL